MTTMVLMKINDGLRNSTQINVSDFCNNKTINYHNNKIIVSSKCDNDEGRKQGYIIADL